MILGLILIYWIAKTFYELADKYKKNNWLYAILGVVSYYGAIFLAGIILGIVLEIMSPGYVNDNEGWLTFLTIPFGVLTCWGTYRLLRNSWSKPGEVSRETLDSDFIPSDANRYKQDER